MEAPVCGQPLIASQFLRPRKQPLGAAMVTYLDLGLLWSGPSAGLAATWVGLCNSRNPQTDQIPLLLSELGVTCTSVISLHLE